jgi:nucleoside-diphosphate-sugar epimerase
MKVLVTGGSGRIGRYVVRDLADAGHTITNADIVPAPGAPGSFLRVDLTQSGEVYQALAQSGAAAVVHLGAWANAGIVPDTRTYGDNVQGTFNVFQACANYGVKRIVSASSAQVYGFAQAPPVILPADEEHPLRPGNSYALSKIAGEQVADYFVTNWGLTILSFRFMGVRTPEELGRDIERAVRDPAGDGRLLWTRTDTRDAAMACRLAIEKETVPSGPYNITGAQVVLLESSTELISQHFGGKTEIRGEMPGRISPLSCARAEVAFGYRPRFLWSETKRHLEASRRP